MIKNNIQYHMPTKLIFGINTFNTLETYVKKRKVLLIHYGGFESTLFMQELLSLDICIVHTINTVKSHPEFKDLKNIYNDVIFLNFDVIVAIGGGSVMDVAKFLSIQNSTKEYTFVENLAKDKIEKKSYAITPIISLPTTSGTSSEITPWATIWDKEEKKKYSLHLPELFSEVAIYDPNLTLALPKEVTIQTGLDVLSHAIESIWNKNANSITLEFSIKAAKLIMTYLPKLVHDLDNILYRQKVMEASMYAGLAFSNTQTALAHAMSYYITINKDIPHGIACSFTLPMLIDAVIGKYAFIDTALMDIFGELSSNKLREMLQSLHISTHFGDYGISPKELEELKDSLMHTQRSKNSLVELWD